MNYSQIETFKRDGMVILPQVLTQDQVERYRDIADYWVASDHKPMRQDSGDGRMKGYRNCISLDPALVELLALPTILPYLVTLLGPDIKLLTSHIIYREPVTDRNSAPELKPGWHRDFAKAQRSLGDERIQRLDIKVAYCLNDLPTENCGGTLFVPGSHMLREPLRIPDNQKPEGYVDPVLKAGDCVLFENRTWHAGGINLSQNTRKVIMFGYTYVWIQSSDYQTQSKDTLAAAKSFYGDVGLQLLNGLDAPEEFDYTYDSKPLTQWANEQQLITGLNTYAY